jgi:uncharacterized protein YbjT (DUF2867 family)
MILITGASGNAGGAVLREALKNDSGVQAMYRTKEDTAKVPQFLKEFTDQFRQQAAKA